MRVVFRFAHDAELTPSEDPKDAKEDKVATNNTWSLPDKASENGAYYVHAITYWWERRICKT